MQLSNANTLRRAYSVGYKGRSNNLICENFISYSALSEMFKIKIHILSQIVLSVQDKNDSCQEQNVLRKMQRTVGRVFLRAKCPGASCPGDELSRNLEFLRKHFAPFSFVGNISQRLLLLPATICPITKGCINAICYLQYFSQSVNSLRCHSQCCTPRLFTAMYVDCYGE